MVPGRIVQVVASLAVGGAERVAVEIACGLVRRGYRASVLVADSGNEGDAGFQESVQREIEARGVPCERVSFSGVRDRAARRRMAGILADEDIALVHVHNRPQDWQIATLGRLLRVPVLYSIHLAYEQTVRQRALYALAARLAPAVVCVSHAVAVHARRYERVPDRKLHVIYNGIRTEVFRPLSVEARARKRTELGWGEGEFIWLCAARLSEQKGHRYLLDGFDRLPEGTRARLVLAGEGPLRLALTDQASRLRHGHRVTFLGPRRDVPELLGAADGYVCASMQEGQPLALLEAMAVGIPVVAPRLPSIEEIATGSCPVFFGPGLSGWAAAHDPAAIGSALASVEARQILRDEAEKVRLWVTGRFSLDAMVEKHAALYEELATRRLLGARRR